MKNQINKCKLKFRMSISREIKRLNYILFIMRGFLIKYGKSLQVRGETKLRRTKIADFLR
jgi:hypothetical protein